MLVKSGLLPVIIGIGVDYLIIYYVHWQLPIMIAVIDFISCIIDLFIPSGWSEQLKCATNKCFNGGDGSSDLLLFTSVPVVINQFGKIMDATLNSNTGRRFCRPAECPSCYQCDSHTTRAWQVFGILCLRLWHRHCKLADVVCTSITGRARVCDVLQL